MDVATLVADAAVQDGKYKAVNAEPVFKLLTKLKAPHGASWPTHYGDYANTFTKSISDAADDFAASEDPDKMPQKYKDMFMPKDDDPPDVRKKKEAAMKARQTAHDAWLNRERNAKAKKRRDEASEGMRRSENPDIDDLNEYTGELEV
jgi:hypothetical protein